MKSLKHKRLLAGFMAVVFAIGAIIPANLSVHASSATELVDTTANSEEEVTEPRLYDADTMQGLNATEIAVANDIVIAAGYGFDIENNFDGITYNDSAVKVSYYADKGSFDGNQAGNYETYYKVEPVSGRETYLICRTITVREPETATQSSASDNSAEESGSEDGESDGDVPDDLSAGEIEELTVEMPMMFMAVSEPLMMASAPATGTQDGPDKMKVSNAGYAKYCGHSMGIKYVSESGAYQNHLVYCLDMNKNTTNGDVSSSSTKSNVKPTITYCLVNGARTLNGTCHNKDYSSGSAAQDYFITGASIHILNGEVSLSYYNNGSSTYQKIAKMVADAKTHADEYSDNGCTISITYDISPKKTDWKDMGDGLYRSTDKFVRTKSGTVKDIKYSISGAPSGLTVGEIKTDSSQIDDEADLKKYDICVAQTDASSASSNFYLYCNEEAMKKIVDNNSTIKIVAKAYSDEKGGRKWTPSVISQQKITFLEDFTPVTAQATVKVTSNFNEGSFSLYKSDKFTHNAVPGARYYLYEDKDCTELLCKLSKTDDKGLSSSGKVILTQDKYYLKEVLEPDGYQRDNEVYEIPLSYFTLYDKDGKVIQQGKRKDVEEIPETIGVFVNKTDVGSGVVLKKAGFAVFNDPACTVRTKLEGQNGSAGEVPVFYYDEDLDMAASQKFVKEQDKYYVKEVDVPDGYKDEAKIYTIAPPYGQFEKIDAVNTPVRCDLTCIKEDKETKNPQGDAKLDGALYGLYAAEDIKYPDGRDIVTYTGADNITSKSGNEFKSTGAKATKDALLATVRTDDKYAFSFGNLYYGNYYVKEIEPSEGYLLDATAYPANFKDAENTHQDISLSCTVKETVKKQAFEIIKVSTDGDTAEEDKVKDAEFTVKLKSDIDKNGWDAAKVYDIFVTDEKGYGKSKELPYGTYVVRETKTPADLYKVADFEVVVNEDSRTPQAWRVLNDAPFKAYIRIVKKDAESNKTVLLSNVTFKIKNVDKDEYVEQKVGSKKVSEFTTDETGTVTTPLKLKYGNYQVEEITAPEGYLISKEAFPFVVTKEGAIQIVEDEDGEPVIEVEAKNTPVKGSITIHKKGEVLTGAEYETIIDRILSKLTGDERSVKFQYEEQFLSGAVFNVIAEEDIYTPDHQLGEDGNRELAIINGVPAKKGAVLYTVTTDKEGKAEIKDLPLGKYQVVEVTPPKGFILCEEPVSVELSYQDHETELVVGEAEFVDARVKTELSLIKTDSVTSYPVSGAVYGVYAKEDIKAVNGGTLTPAAIVGEPAYREDTEETTEEVSTDAEESKEEEVSDAEETTESAEDASEDAEESEDTDTAEESSEDATEEASGDAFEDDEEAEESNVFIHAGELICVAETDENGKAVFDADLPLGQYVVKEIDAPAGYLLDETEYPVDFSYQGFTTETIPVSLETKDTPIIVEVSKTDLTTGKELIGATLEVLDSEGKTYASWKTDGKPYQLEAIPAGEYTLRETAAPYGYTIANEVAFTVEETGEIQKVFMSDERVKGQIQIFKTCSKTKKPLAGVEFELRDKDDKVLAKLVTDKVGYAETEMLDVCTYDENGNAVSDIPYYIVETKAAEGYVLDDTKYECILHYEGDVRTHLIYKLELKNKPEKPKLPQTGGNYHAWLFGALGGMCIGAGIYVYRRRRKYAGK